MTKVYVGMSGGVDSSVAAALLVEQGFEVVGVYMKNWTQDVSGIACPWKQDLADARAAAVAIDIPFKIFDFQDQYKKQVVDVMVREYQAGRTPNPDIMCNQEIKFKLFLEVALADGADMIATGHYARNLDGKLTMGTDTNKDQSYFLYRITPEALVHIIFPLGDLTKPEVRQIAAKLELPTATKPDSQGICFVGEVGIKAFLSQYVATLPGPIVDRHGERIGTHDGAIFYTTGQRQGLRIGGAHTYYVIGKDMATNTVTVTSDAVDLDLKTKTFKLTDLHWINDAPSPDHLYSLRLRHRGELLHGLVAITSGTARIELAASERAVTAGQSAVVYDGEQVLGGGLVLLG
jgi:tRNA-specific 2-thiouridylase